MRKTDAETIAELQLQVLDLQRELQGYRNESRQCHNGRVWSDTYDRNLDIDFCNANRLMLLVAELEYEERNGIRHGGDGTAGNFVAASTCLTDVCNLVNQVVRYIEDGGLSLPFIDIKKLPKLHLALAKQLHPDLQ